MNMEQIDEGIDAFDHGHTTSECPYVYATIEWRSWMHGYDFARNRSLNRELVA